MYAVSPLRYPGAKWRLEKFVHSVLVANKLEGGHYAEPFAGGASLAISLLLQNYVSEIHLNDLDKSIYSFWQSALHQTNELIELISATPVTIDTWNEQKLVQLNKNHATPLELGFSTFFLNRTNRSGILTAGVIGGKNQTGNWKIDARFNKENLILRILRIAEKRDSIHIYNLDAVDFLKVCNTKIPEKSFVYLDPPYFVKGQELYMNFYNQEDHFHLSNFVLEELNKPWMVSYDDVPEIKSLYSKARATEEPYLLPYSASKERKGKEIFFLSPNLDTETNLIHTSTRTKRALGRRRLSYLPAAENALKSKNFRPEVDDLA
ncbi:DNA adenine methylase [Pseudomonas gingeri]|uniref:site-specific DNA-methyltransferase (adenine-specific) n=1 Tax=Pseudomonas gingeri TaxID=117681 RepID=A0A7Y7XA03_9PSED|nr:DNA adenine methylase [Pseudomonas gingeri]NWB94828.1 DNA adenine methylase [Pseudomonas gingeri]